MNAQKKKKKKNVFGVCDVHTIEGDVVMQDSAALGFLNRCEFERGERGSSQARPRSRKTLSRDIATTDDEEESDDLEEEEEEELACLNEKNGCVLTAALLCSSPNSSEATTTSPFERLISTIDEEIVEPSDALIKNVYDLKIVEAETTTTTTTGDSYKASEADDDDDEVSIDNKKNTNTDISNNTDKTTWRRRAINIKATKQAMMILMTAVKISSKSSSSSETTTTTMTEHHHEPYFNKQIKMLRTTRNVNTSPGRRKYIFTGSATSKQQQKQTKLMTTTTTTTMMLKPKRSNSFKNKIVQPEIKQIKYSEALALMEACVELKSVEDRGDDNDAIGNDELDTNNNNKLPSSSDSNLSNSHLKTYAIDALKELMEVDKPIEILTTTTAHENYKPIEILMTTTTTAHENYNDKFVAMLSNNDENEHNYKRGRNELCECIKCATSTIEKSRKLANSIASILDKADYLTANDAEAVANDDDDDDAAYDADDDFNQPRPRLYTYENN